MNWVCNYITIIMVNKICEDLNTCDYLSKQLDIFTRRAESPKIILV